jgi:hypothetical protein
MFMCRDHWFTLPKKIQNAIWREYRPGQEKDKKPSLRYLAVQRLACSHLAFKPHDEQAALACAQILAEAIQFQQAAIQAGVGDPLEGLVPA